MHTNSIKNPYVIPESLFDIVCEFQNTLKLIALYKEYDYSVALRGHGQLIPIGINLPSLYLSTQPKIIQFALKNGFEDYTVDIREKDWFETLNEKIRLLKDDKNFLNEWYSIRDQFMPVYKNQMVNFCKKTWELL